MMKKLTFIFTIYILLLAILPCTDLQAQHNEVSHDIEEGISCDDESETHSDACTPFCICECCHTVVQTVKTLNIPSPTLNVEKIYLFTYFNFQHFYSSFFIPPKF